VEDYRSEMFRVLSRNLLRRGFIISELDLSSSAVFDIIARREDDIYIIKFLHNIDTLRKSSSAELMEVAAAISATPIIIGKRMSGGDLEDGILYYRHHIPILTLESYIDYVDGIKPYVYSGPGGYYVSLNSSLIRKKREAMGYSIGYISSKIGVSRKSITLYESGSDVTVDIFLKLQKFLGSDIVASVDFKRDIRSMRDINSTDSTGDEFVREVSSLVSEKGIMFFNFTRSPFDAIFAEEEQPLALLDLMRDMVLQLSRIESLKNIASVLENEFAILTRQKTEKEVIHGCPVVSLDDLKTVSEADELLGIIRQKRNSL